MLVFLGPSSSRTRGVSVGTSLRAASAEQGTLGGFVFWPQRERHLSNIRVMAEVPLGRDGGAPWSLPGPLKPMGWGSLPTLGGSSSVCCR